MFISKSNVIQGRAPSIISGASSGVPSNMTSPDFSLNYTASGNRLVLSFGAVSNLEYVAVCVSNLGSSGRVVARNGQSRTGYQSIRGQYDSEREHVCMFNFAKENFTDLIIVIDTESNKKPIVSYIAAGEAIEVPNGGETSGHQRNWLTRAVETRTQGNDLYAPVAVLRKRMALSGSLSLPNMTTDFARNEWQKFLDYAETQPFFICEQEKRIVYSSQEQYRADGGLPEASYLCHSPKFSAPRAHSDTRKLQNISLRFDCYNGI